MTRSYTLITYKMEEMNTRMLEMEARITKMEAPALPKKEIVLPKKETRVYKEDTRFKTCDGKVVKVHACHLQKSSYLDAFVSRWSGKHEGEIETEHSKETMDNVNKLLCQPRGCKLFWYRNIQESISLVATRQVYSYKVG